MMKKFTISLIIIMVLISLTVVSKMYGQGQDVIADDSMFMISHSEYWSGEEGQVIARLYNWQGNPITVDNCTVDIYYPDKTLFVIEGETDDSLQTTTGTHFYNFTTPETEGVYQYYATCNYDSKSRTVANSFHLSPALNFQMNLNDSITALTAQELAHYIVVTDNLTSIRDELGVVGVDVNQVLLDLLGLNTTVNGIDVNVDQVLLDLLHVNGTVNSIETKVDTLDGKVNTILVNLTTIDGNVDQLLVDLAVVDANVDQLLIDVGVVDGNVDQLLIDVGVIDGNVDQLLLDVADVQTDTTFIRNNMFTTDNITLITDGQQDILNNISVLKTYCDDAETSGSQLCIWVSNINDQVNDINASTGNNNAILAEINATTHSTYDYMTGTLTTTVNSLFGVTGQINSTVNRIETTTVQINDTVSTIQTNQEEVVYMEVTS